MGNYSGTALKTFGIAQKDLLLSDLTITILPLAFSANTLYSGQNGANKITSSFSFNK